MIIVCRYPEPDPQTSTSGTKNSFLTGRSLEENQDDPSAYKITDCKTLKLCLCILFLLSSFKLSLNF